jgi:3-methylcrotonyl-CoA carboxylase alpha subunit
MILYIAWRMILAYNKIQGLSIFFSIKKDQFRSMFQKILIANRGEIACRIIRTAQRMKIATVAVYSEIDVNALHVKLADESVCIGPAVSSESYLNYDRIIQAATATSAQAVHPGYGFLSEDAEFAERLIQAGFVFIGPSPEAIRIMGDKQLAKTTMEAAGVPVVPGFHDGQDYAKLEKAARRIGLPVLIKASAGGGGKGMRLVENWDQLKDALTSAQREAQSSFGDNRVFLEKYLANARHIEVQILFDQFGEGVYLFDRDCSIQRRHQKVIEEAPADLSPAIRQQIYQTALQSGKAIGYCNAGTIEFLVDEQEHFYFMEMNTRLQVEHPITELITGLDLVEWQLRIAAGEPLALKQNQLKINGHAIEARLYAENPESNFMPSAGHLKYVRFPQEQLSAVRIDTGIQTDDQVSIYYDPLLAKLISWGKDRAEAIQHLQDILNNTVVFGIHTNWLLLNRIIKDPDFLQRKITTHYLNDKLSALLTEEQSSAPGFVLVIASLAILRQRQAESQSLQDFENDSNSPWLIQDGWRLNGAAKTLVTFWEGSQIHSIRLQKNDTGWILEWNDKKFQATIHWLDSFSTKLIIDHQHYSATVILEDQRLNIFTDARQWIFSLRKPNQTHAEAVNKKSLNAPMPGTLIEIYVQPGEKVTTGQRLLIIEAMKMEHALIAPRDAQIDSVFYKPGDRVQEGVELITFTD